MPFYVLNIKVTISQNYNILLIILSQNIAKCSSFSHSSEKQTNVGTKLHSFIFLNKKSSKYVVNIDYFHISKKKSNKIKNNPHFLAFLHKKCKYDENGEFFPFVNKIDDILRKWCNFSFFKYDSHNVKKLFHVLHFCK